MPKRFVRILAILVTILIGNAGFACSCPVVAFETLVDQSDSILIVRIVSVEDALAGSGRSIWARYKDDPPLYSEGSNYGLRAEFTVLRTLKQTGALPSMLRTGYGGGDCGVDLTPGTNYLLLTDSSGSVTLCSGSRAVGFHDGINCRMQNYIAAIERRIADPTSEVLPDTDASIAIDHSVSAALQAGKSAFDAECDQSRKEWAE